MVKASINEINMYIILCKGLSCGSHGQSHDFDPSWFPTFTVHCAHAQTIGKGGCFSISFLLDVIWQDGNVVV